MNNINGVTNYKTFDDSNTISFSFDNRIEYSNQFISIKCSIIIRDVKTCYPRMILKEGVDTNYPHLFRKPLYFCVGTTFQLDMFQTKNKYDVTKWFIEYGIPNLCAYYYWKKYGTFPHGEYSHNQKGIYQSIIEETSVCLDNIEFFKDILVKEQIKENDIITAQQLEIGLKNIDYLALYPLEFRLQILEFLGEYYGE